MTSAFSSWDEFWLMGSYALYVWLAVAISLLSLAALVGCTLWQHRQLLRNAVKRQQREQRLRQAKQQEGS